MTEARSRDNGVAKTAWTDIDLPSLIENLSITAVLATAAIAVYIYLGWFWACVFIGVGLISYTIWLRQRGGWPNNTGMIVIAQLSVLAALLLVFSEMIWRGFASAFAQRLPALVSPPVSFNEFAFVCAFPLTLMSVFMGSAAVTIVRYTPINFFILCFSTVFAIALPLVVIGGSIASGRVLPGAWTCIVPLIVGSAALVRVVLTQREPT